MMDGQTLQIRRLLGTAATRQNFPARISVLPAKFETDATIGTGYQYSSHADFSFRTISLIALAHDSGAVRRTL
jgi:hypothetical protein